MNSWDIPKDSTIGIHRPNRVLFSKDSLPEDNEDVYEGGAEAVAELLGGTVRVVGDNPPVKAVEVVIRKPDHMVFPLFEKVSSPVPTENLKDIADETWREAQFRATLLNHLLPMTDQELQGFAKEWEIGGNPYTMTRQEIMDALLAEPRVRKLVGTPK